MATTFKVLHYMLKDKGHLQRWRLSVSCSLGVFNWEEESHKHGEKTLSIKVKCNNYAFQEKCFRKVIATRPVQQDYKTYSSSLFLQTRHIHPRLKDMAAGSPA